MKKSTLLFFICFISVGGFAQEVSKFAKECRISGGVGYGQSTNSGRGNVAAFVQMDYIFMKNFSMATEYEHLEYNTTEKLRSSAILNSKNYDDNISLLLKYHIPLPTRLKSTVACGWTYLVRQSNYRGVTGTYTSSAITVPVQLEAYYPVWKGLSAGVRTRCNFNLNESTVSATAGLSLLL